MIKNFVTFSLIIFITAVIAILGFAVFFNQVQQTGNTTNTGSGIALAEVLRHNLPSDCWLVINGKVYNVTNYINLHPAGPETITPYCGADATTAFNTRNGRGPHSQNAQNILNSYYVGNIAR